MEELHRVTDAPLLPRDASQALFEEVSKAVQLGPFFLSDATKRVRDALVARSMPVRRTHVGFVLKGLSWAGHRFAPDLPQDPRTLALAYSRQLQYLLDRGEPRTLDGAVMRAAISHCTGGLVTPDEIRGPSTVIT